MIAFIKNYRNIVLRPKRKPIIEFFLFQWLLKFFNSLILDKGKNYISSISSPVLSITFAAMQSAAWMIATSG